MEDNSSHKGFWIVCLVACLFIIIVMKDILEDSALIPFAIGAGVSIIGLVVDIFKSR